MTKIKYILIFLLFICASVIYAQQEDYEFTSQSNKAIRIYKKAEQAYIARDLNKAKKFLEKTIDKYSSFIEAYLLLGDVLAEMKKTAEAITIYQKAIQIDSTFSPKTYYFLALLQIEEKQYEDAVKNLSYFLQFKHQNYKIRERAASKLRIAKFASEAYNNPVPFNPVNLGDSINSMADEYINAITADGKKLIFTRRTLIYQDSLSKKYSEGIFQSLNKDSIWGKASELSRSLNRFANIGALTISPDGRYIFFTACHAPVGYGSCDLYYAVKTGKSWGSPINLGPIINTTTWESQPSFSSDGRTLYFASTRKGGYGSSDIWKSFLHESGRWSKPVNLGRPINTVNSEMAPFIHPDGETMYFSSDGHLGLKESDLYYTSIQKDGTWKKPVNLGYPINTDADEINIIVEGSGKKAYISSDKLGGKGNYDIYVFDLYEEVQPKPVTYMKGRVFDEETKEPLQAKFELIDLQTGEVKVESFSDPYNGEFLVVLPTDKDYALNVSKKNYLFYSDNFRLSGFYEKAEPFIKDVYLKPIKPGKITVLKNIFFETDKYSLKSESRIELEKLIKFMQYNPSVKIEISGHTDTVGTKEYNLELSEKRAKAVYDYLTDNGISSNRLDYEGYGYSRPIDTNETEEGRANNRRTEFKIIK